MMSKNPERTAVAVTGQAPDCRDLVLGTVQLGLPYGIANATGQPDQASARAIVSAAWRNGVRYFDTAQAYGASESVLGGALAAQPAAAEARVVTKLKLGLGAPEAKGIISALEDSLGRLRQNSLWGVLLHNEEDLDRWTEARAAFSEARARGLVRHVGVSVYSPERALQALGCDGIDILQVAANVFDRRMQRAGVLRRAAREGKQVFIRSIYLQGLVLLSPELVKAKMPFACAASERLQGFCRRHGLAPQRFAIDHVRHQAEGGRIIIGAETEAQVSENCLHFMEPPLSEHLHRAWTDEWPDDIPDLVDPRTWPVTKPGAT